MRRFRIALETARALGASYADIRVVTRRDENIVVKNGKVDALESSEESGFGVRALVNGRWGFASSSKLDDEEIEKTAELAVRIARASARAKTEDVTLSPVDAICDSYKTSYDIDPFTVSIDEKIELLMDAERLMRGKKGIRVSTATMGFRREEKIFLSSDGAEIAQEIVESGAGISAVAADANDIQERSYPGGFGGDFAAKGYEFVKSLDLAGHAEEIAQQAIDLLDAPQCPSTTTDLILGSNQLALQIHESCGHPSELDRVFGTEASYAGTSFLTPEKQGTFRYGSPEVTIVADATVPGGLGTFGYDDEGVPAQRTELVKKGIFINYLTSRETAGRVNQRSNGCMRADGWNRMPIIRMTNINLMPGDWTLDEIIRDTKDGIFMDTNKSWSIDDKRLNFQFGTEIAWEIKNGEMGRMLKNATYTGITPEFWRSCDAIANEDFWHLWGLPSCGKGEPLQIAHVGHGASPARFRRVRVGVGRW
ncbi:MAG TPA: TldD/PmbA family protein [Firmicutes bacterium]|nr:TldD/PmbA family protein [Bacillota bacterium]